MSRSHSFARCTRTVRVASVLASVALLGACGSNEGIPKDVSSGLTQQVDAIESTAVAGDYAAARQRAADLRAQVDTLRQQGALDEVSAQRVLRAVTAVESELDVPTTTPAIAAAATTVAPRATPPTTTRAPVATTTTREPKGKGKKDD